MSRTSNAVLAASLLLTIGAIAPRLALGDELSELRSQMAKQRQYMEALEKRLVELEGKQREHTTKTKGIEAGYTRGAAQAQEIYDGGFYVRTEDESFSLKINGFTQARYTFLSPENGKDNHNFDLALARLAFSGSAFDPSIAYFFQFEGTTFGNNNRATLLDWWMKYSFSPDLSVQAGRFILPYSRQFYTHPGNLLFTDLSEADYAFNLQRAVGVHAAGQFGRLSYHAAATNSIRALDAGGQQNIGDEIATLGRVELAILEPYGYLESSPHMPSAPQFSVGMAAAFNPIDEASSFQNVMPGDRTTNVTVDAGFRLGPLSLQAAGHYRRNNFTSPGPSDGHDWGYYGQIGYYLVPGQWELAARISGVDFQRANNPSTLGDVTEYLLGLNYYLYGHNAKVQLDYSFLDRDPFTGANRGDHRVRVQTQILF